MPEIGQANIALLSPSENMYSETFIQAHKERLKGNIFYYYSGELPTKLEGGIVINSRCSRIVDIVKGHYRLNKFSLEEQALITSFKKNNIELVFAEFGFMAQKILPVCKTLGLPLIVHFHGLDATREDYLKNTDYYKEVFAYAEFVVAVSKKMYRDLLEMGCQEHKLVYNVYGPNDDFFEVKPNFSNKQFICIGRFVDKKAPYYLILSFLEVVKKHPEAKLILAGDGDLWNTCKNLVKFYGLQSNITFPGVVSPQQFRQYLQESLALVQHSITAEDGNQEGTPVSILEASAAGLPILSTRHAGIPDVVEEGKTGLLVEEHDVAGMTANMLKLLENPELAMEMGKNGRANIKANFTMNRHIGVLDGLIVTVIAPQ